MIDFNEINNIPNMKNLESDFAETGCDVQNHNDESTLLLKNDKSLTNAVKIDETNEEKNSTDVKNLIK